jgi:hypothetical protein
MGGDYTRVTFRPTADYVGVLKQQGRVALDADHNEQVDLEDRRARASMLDVVGRAAVPISDPANATAFAITVPAAGQLAIGRGRMYVDGILVECHGRGPYATFDPRLAESTGSGTVAYAAAVPNGQPYFPVPLPPAPSAAGTTDLVYLDVWRREVTALEDPALREVALGGPDTATRWQTVWQVRLLKGVTAGSCADPVAAFDALTRPSGARLTVDPPVAPPSADPCVVEVAGGYTGLENRLYRVEVHVPGPLGTARFKWSRDNASVAAAVEGVATAGGNARLTVSTLGWDQVQRFQPGDWVEVLDDWCEWRQEAGHLARVFATDPANRLLTLVGAIPAAFGFDPTDATRHTRVRKWMPAEAGAAGALVANAGPIQLDPGVSIRFAADPTGGDFRVGDHWVFAARTIDGTVERLDRAPPRGTHHHYARLALVTWGAAPASTTVLDCRVLWPGDEGCCTEVVAPGEDVQAAIDRLPPVGGCVCLKAGVHDIRAALRIARSGVALHGESPGAIVRRANGADALAIGDASGGTTVRGVTVHDLRFEVANEGNAIVSVSGAESIDVHDCVLAVQGGGVGMLAGVQVRSARGVRLSRLDVDGAVIGVWGTESRDVSVDDGLFVGPRIALAAAPLDGGLAGVILDGVAAPLRVRDCRIRQYGHGVVIGARGEGALVTGNRVERATPSAVPTVKLLTGMLADPPSAGFALVGDHTFGIVTVAPRCIVADNEVVQAVARHGGILALGSATHVERNRLRCPLGEPAASTELDGNAQGIVVLSPSDASALQDVLVCGNVLTGPQHGIFAVGPRAGLRGARIEANHLDTTFTGGANPLVAVLVTGAAWSSVTGNRVERYGSGVFAAECEALDVSGNQLEVGSYGVIATRLRRSRVAANAVAGPRVAGVLAVEFTAVELVDNVIALGLEGTQYGIGLGGGASNRVRGGSVALGTTGIYLSQERDAEVSDVQVAAARAAGVLAVQAADVRVRGCRVLNCGHSPPANGFGVGIALWQVIGDASVDACEVIETGRAGDRQAPGLAYAILGMALPSWHVHRNVVRGPAGEIAARHAGVTLLLGTDAEFTDNAVTGEGVGALLDVRRVGDFRPTGVLCSANRFVRTNVAATAAPPPAPVLIAAQRASATGNQVRVPDRKHPSIDFTGTVALSAVGNVTSTDWLGVPSGPNLRPAPHPAFNVILF